MTQIYKSFDNGGKTLDRYTILTEAWHFGKSCDCLGVSDDCDSPQGFSQWGDCVEGEHLGREIAFDELPQNVQNHVMARIGDGDK